MSFYGAAIAKRQRLSRPIANLTGRDGRGAGIRMFGATGQREHTDEHLLDIDRDGPPGARLALDSLSKPEESARWTVWGPVAGQPRARALETKKLLLSEPDPLRRRENIKQAQVDEEIEPKPGHPWEAMIGRGTMGLGGFAGSWMWIDGGQMMALFRRHTHTLGEHAAIIGRSAVVHPLTRRRAAIPTWLFPIPPTWLRPPEDHEPNTYRVGFDTPVRARDMHWYRQPGMRNPYDRGVGVMQSLRPDLALDASAAAYLNAISQSKGQARSLLFFPGTHDTPAEDAISLALEDTRGPERASRLTALYGPNAEGDHTPKLYQLGLSPADLETNETRGGLRDDFLRTGGVPPGAVGVSADVNRANAQVHRETLRDTIIHNLEATRRFHAARYFEPLGDVPAEYFGEDRLFPMWDLDPLRDPETARIVASRVPEAFSERQLLRIAGFDGGDPEKRFQRSTVSVTGSEFNPDLSKAKPAEDRTGRQAFGREDEDLPD